MTLILSTSQASAADSVEDLLHEAIVTSNRLAAELQYTLDRFRMARTQPHGEFPSAWLLAEYAQSASMNAISASTTRLGTISATLGGSVLRLGRGV